MGKRISFDGEPPFNLDEAVEKIHKIAEKSENVFLMSGHAKERSKERKASSRQIFDVLRNGQGVDGPKLDEYGDWRIKMKHYTCGRYVQVVVALKKNSVIVVTVI